MNEGLRAIPPGSDPTDLRERPPMRSHLARLAAIMSLSALAPTAPARAEDAPNPIYRDWSRFKPGTAVTHRAVTITAGERTEITTTQTLSEVTDRSVVIERVVVIKRDGTVTENPPQRLESPKSYTLPPGVKRPDPAKVKPPIDQGEETREAAGVELKTKWVRERVRLDTGDTATRTWTSADVPGGLVRAESTTPAIQSTTTMDLIGLTKKP